MTSSDAARVRVSVYVARSGRDRVRAMAAAQSTEAVDVTPSAVYRQLLLEGMAGRVRDCARGHRGPVAGQVCGHCGRPVP